jgi:uncharacterized protein YdeI (YjbR/CyaY-like superfamily)
LHARLEFPFEKTLIGHVKQTVALNTNGVKARPLRAELKMPADLKKALAGNAAANKAFAAFTPGYRREYIEWVIDAKRPETRAARIETAVKQCAEGKILHHKYRR